VAAVTLDLGGMRRADRSAARAAPSPASAPSRAQAARVLARGGRAGTRGCVPCSNACAPRRNHPCAAIDIVVREL